MTIFLVQFVCAFLLLTVIHITAMAHAGQLLGVGLREYSIGTGKALASWGRLRIRAIPFGGYVRFVDTRTELTSDAPMADTNCAYNYKPKAIQALIPLIGPAALVLVAVLLQPATAVHEVLTGFRQIVAGAFAPMSTAQHYIQATYALALEAGFLPVFGLLAAKTAAFNLLPFPWTNGGQALLALLRVDRTTTPAWQTRLNSPAMLVFTALLVSWAVALCVFVVRT